MTWRAAGVLAAAAGAAAVGLSIGAWRWRSGTSALVAEVTARRAPPAAAVYRERDLAGLPDVVARYFRATVRDGQPVIRAARATQEGQFRTEESEDAWRTFTAVQAFGTRPPGFVWDARIAMAPGVAVHVRDAYVAGRGSTSAAILGLVPVVEVSGAPEMAAGALQRFLAEAAWLPTALLPGQGVHWAAIDDTTARATLADGATAVSLDFRFGANGDIAEVFTASRYREAGGRFVPTPWSGRFGASGARHGMRVPLSAEVAWTIDGRRFPYWRGRITSIAFEME